MMRGKVPIISSSFGLRELLLSLFLNKKNALNDFAAWIAGYLGCRDVFLTNSGITAFFVILKSLSARDLYRNEVVLPDYTASSLVVAVQAAGLRAVLCDVSLSDFNIDKDSALALVTDKTLAIVLPHMFGIPIPWVKQIKENVPEDVVIIEDCAQAMGAKVGGVKVGSLSDVSFFSFGRGKNFPLYQGGCICINNALLSDSIRREYSRLPEPGFSYIVGIFVKCLLFSLVSRRLVFAWLHRLVEFYKDNKPSKSFEIMRMDILRSLLGLTCKEKFDSIITGLNRNGLYLVNNLKDMEDKIILPQLAQNTYPVFNRFPLLLKDECKVKLLQHRLWEAGIESSRMYRKPLHRLYELGYAPEAFLNSCFVAGHLLTLPLHRLVSDADLDLILGIIREVL